MTGIKPPPHRTIWPYDIEHAVYENACAAMELRPDYPQIERVWSALDERFKFMRYDYNEEVDEDQFYQIDIHSLASEASVDREELVSHLRTLLGAGCLRSVDLHRDIDSVSVVIAPHMKARLIDSDALPS